MQHQIYDWEYNFIPNSFLERIPFGANPLKTAKMQNIKVEIKKLIQIYVSYNKIVILLVNVSIYLRF